VDDVDYLYREYVILTRERDADRVEEAITRILAGAGDGAAVEGRMSRDRVGAGVVRLMIPRGTLLVPKILDLLDEEESEDGDEN